jgi:hypothetical protein
MGMTASPPSEIGRVSSDESVWWTRCVFTDSPGTRKPGIVAGLVVDWQGSLRRQQGTSRGRPGVPVEAGGPRRHCRLSRGLSHRGSSALVPRSPFSRSLSRTSARTRARTRAHTATVSRYSSPSPCPPAPSR